jgi:hypothetical protein
MRRRRTDNRIAAGILASREDVDARVADLERETRSLEELS